MAVRKMSWLVVAIVVAACSPSESTSVSTVSTDPPGESVSLAPSGATPAISHDSLDAGYVLGAAGAYWDDLSHVWVVAFGTGPASSPSIRHLTSTDGRIWTAEVMHVDLGADALGLNDVGPIPSSVLVDADGTWQMYGGGRLDGSDDPIVWRATSPGPDGPWTMHPEPVLVPSADGWDNAITDHPSVVLTDDGYLMAYGGAGRSDRNRNRIGVARSADGITWAREPASLPEADDADALGPTACGMAARTMFEPELIEISTGFRLLFGVMVDDDMFIGAADSADGRTWSCASDDALLGPSDFAGESVGLHSYVLVRDDPRGSLLAEVLSDDASDLWLVLPSDV